MGGFMSTELNGLLGLVVLILDIWAIVKIFQSGEKTGAKVLWTLLIVLLPIIGLIVWAFLGPRGPSGISRV
jgi:hypothetical protein